MAVSENSKIVFEYVKANDGSNMTAEDIEAGTGISKKSITPIVNAWVKKNVMERVEAEIEVAGSEGPEAKKVKFIKLTDFGRSYQIPQE